MQDNMRCIVTLDTTNTGQCIYIIKMKPRLRLKVSTTYLILSKTNLGLKLMVRYLTVRHTVYYAAKALK